MSKFLPVACLLVSAVLIVSARAEPAGSVSHSSTHLPNSGTTTSPALISAPAPASAPGTAPAAGAASVPAVRPPEPLAMPSVMVAHPDKVLVETVTLAGHRLVAGGLGGLLILSDDNGASWRQIQLPVRATLTALHFTDDRNGWAAGHYGVVLRTQDAGEHWTLVEDGPRAAQAMLEAARAGNEADNVRAQKIQAAQALAQTDPARPFLLIQSSGSDTIRLIGAGILSAETTDGGQHWRPWSDGIGNPEGVLLDGLASRNGLVLAAGAHGTLLAGKPEDGLHKLPSPYDGTFFGVLDGGSFGFVLFGQQGHAYASTALGPDWAPGREVAWHAVVNPSQTTLTAGLVRQDGSVLLGDASGAVWKLGGKPDTPRLDPVPVLAPFPILALAEAPDHALILAGSGGILRVPPPA